LKPERASHFLHFFHYGTSGWTTWVQQLRYGSRVTSVTAIRVFEFKLPRFDATQLRSLEQHPVGNAMTIVKKTGIPRTRFQTP